MVFIDAVDSEEATNDGSDVIAALKLAQRPSFVRPRLT